MMGVTVTGRRVLAIANRAEIAIRVAHTARRLGWQPVALLGDPDLDSLAAREIGAVERVGPAGAELNVEAVVVAARRAGATALHPGYGFLSEREELSRACREAGITFIGPSPETLALCGDKIATRAAAVRAGVPVLPASDPLTPDDEDRWRAEAERVGYPLIAKVAGGGGGRGLRVAPDAASLDGAVHSALREAGASGAGTRLYLERFLFGARHVEVQVSGTGRDAVALGDRDCSIQRRHQKVVEEAPAFGLSPTLREQLHGYAVAMAREVGLRGVGTVEFLLSGDGELFFIEVNPRLQVEHTVTEEVTGLDLVAVQLDLAFGDRLPEPVHPTGHAIQARIYAEDPFHGSIPTPGRIDDLRWPRGAGIRVDAGYASGDTIPSTYDAMIGKIITWGNDREAAIERLDGALHALRVDGMSTPEQPVMTNQPWLLALLDNPSFRAADHTLELAGQITVEERAPQPEEVVPALESLLATTCDDAGAWASSGPFRLLGQATQMFHGLEAGGWEQCFAVRWDRQVSQWRASTEGGSESFSMESRGTTPSADIRADAALDIISPYGRWSAHTGTLPALARDEELADGVLRAPMPGTVTAINVVEGQPVSKGDVLAVMVAMKIEMTMASPFEGVVERIHCATGDLVGSRQALVTVAPAAVGGRE